MIICVAAVHRLFWKLRRLDNTFSRTSLEFFSIKPHEMLSGNLDTFEKDTQIHLRKRIYNTT